jgi:hypothetical protein
MEQASKGQIGQPAACMIEIKVSHSRQKWSDYGRVMKWADTNQPVPANSHKNCG